MLVVGLVLACAAALLHVYIFYLESAVWTTKARGVFGTTEAEAHATKELAYNQGFYNLFLAIVTALGVLLVAIGQRPVGLALVFAGAGSMVAAALVLAFSDRTKASAAAKQGIVPALAIVALVIFLLA